MHLSAIDVVQFVTNGNIIHHRRATMIHQANSLLPLEYDLFYKAFVENGESLELHGQTKRN